MCLFTNRTGVRHRAEKPPKSRRIWKRTTSARRFLHSLQSIRASHRVTPVPYNCTPCMPSLLLRGPRSPNCQSVDVRCAPRVYRIHRREAPVQRIASTPISRFLRYGPAKASFPLAFVAFVRHTPHPRYPALLLGLADCSLPLVSQNGLRNLNSFCNVSPSHTSRTEHSLSELPLSSTIYSFPVSSRFIISCSWAQLLATFCVRRVAILVLVIH